MAIKRVPLIGSKYAHFIWMLEHSTTMYEFSCRLRDTPNEISHPDGHGHILKTLYTEVYINPELNADLKTYINKVRGLQDYG